MDKSYLLQARFPLACRSAKRVFLSSKSALMSSTRRVFVVRAMLFRTVVTPSGGALRSLREQGARFQERAKFCSGAELRDRVQLFERGRESVREAPHRS